RVVRVEIPTAADDIVVAIDGLAGGETAHLDDAIAVHASVGALDDLLVDDHIRPGPRRLLVAELAHIPLEHEGAADGSRPVHVGALHGEIPAHDHIVIAADTHRHGQSGGGGTTESGNTSGPETHGQVE